VAPHGTGFLMPNNFREQLNLGVLVMNRLFSVAVVAIAALLLQACPEDRPVAEAGPSQAVSVGQSVTLDGSASSDPSGKALSYHWAFSSIPATSTAVLSDVNIAKPSFTADLAGTYLVELIVSSSDKSSVPDVVTITASATPLPFVHATVTQPCATCHDGGNSTGKPVTHIASSNLCETCHTLTAWKPVAHVDHAQTIGSCSGCHNSIAATGKPATHVVTTQECGTCHSTTAWLPATIPPPAPFDHSTVVGTTCVTCHNGTNAKGKNTAHLSTSNDCQLCHTSTTSWIGAIVNHAAVTGSCVHCHNGSTKGRALPSGHCAIAAGVDCAACHGSTSNWIASITNLCGTTPPPPPAVFDHATVVGTACASCHDGTGVKAKTGKSAAHLPTSLACDDCHKSVATWSGAKVDHAAIAVNCVSCHSGVFAGARGKSGRHLVGLNTSNICEACHVKAPAAWKPILKFDHLQIQPATACAICHDGTGTLTNNGKNVMHIATNLDCETCHTSSAWKPAAVDHTGLVNGCEVCHDGVKASGFGGKHLIGLITSVQCESCHNKFPLKWIVTTRFDHTQTTIAVCSTCHNNRLARGKYAGHPSAPRDCGACHTVQKWF